MLETLIRLIVILSALLMAMMIHELGHLVVGKLSGYRLDSFTVSLLHIYKEEQMIKFKMRKLTPFNLLIGHCGMITDQDFKNFNPFWFNFGGILFNLLMWIFSWVITENIQLNDFLMLCLRAIMLLNLTGAIMNLLPLKMFGQQTDGYNMIRGFHPIDRRSMYILNILESKLKKGKRYREFDIDLLFVDSGEKMNRFYVAYLVMIYALHLMDKGEHEGAMKELNRLDLKLLPYEWRCEVKCEMLYDYLVRRCDETKYQTLYEDEELKDFLQRSEATPKRVLAAYTWIVLGDKDKGERLINEAMTLAQRLEGGDQAMELDSIAELKACQNKV